MNAHGGTASVKDQVSAADPKPILDGAGAQSKRATRGLGGQFAWPALLRKLNRLDPAYKT